MQVCTIHYSKKELTESFWVSDLNSQDQAMHGGKQKKKNNREAKQAKKVIWGGERVAEYPLP